jgi:pyruvate formate lyase activating enzyme
MRFHGLKKLTLIDYPKHIACTAFTHGCTLRCPFCHNPELVIEKPGQTESIEEEELLSFLHTRIGKLDGIVFTGGEPLIHTATLIPLLKKIKEMDLLIKLDSNGTFPKELETIVSGGLADFVAMDFKTTPELYHQMGADDKQTENILRSLKFLKTSGVPYEIRTTMVPGLHTDKVLEEMMPYLKDVPAYVLQNFEPNDTLDPSYSEKDPFSPEQMRKFLAIATRYNPRTALRSD